MTVSSTSGSTIKKWLIKGCHFALAHFGYTFKLDYKTKNLKRYSTIFTLLLCYTIVSYKTITTGDFTSFLINVIWTFQIFTTAIVNHWETTEIRNKKAASAVPAIGGAMQRSPWGHRLMYYSLVIAVGFLIIIFTKTQKVNLDYEIFTVIAYFIAFWDGCLDVLVGIFEATVD